MIALPSWAKPQSANAALIDFGQLLRPSSGAAVQRVDRKGSRYRLQVSLPPMQPDRARIVVSRLVQAKRQGLRIAFPLLHSQGSPGSVKVDGAGQAGTAIDLKGFNPGYSVREGYWLSIENEDGQHFLHNVAESRCIGSDGLAANLAIEPALRWPFLNNATVHLAVPLVEGFVEGEAWSWETPLNRLIAVSFPLEEAG